MTRVLRACACATPACCARGRTWRVIDPQLTTTSNGLVGPPTELLKVHRLIGLTGMSLGFVGSQKLSFVFRPSAPGPKSGSSGSSGYICGNFLGFRPSAPGHKWAQAHRAQSGTWGHIKCTQCTTHYNTLHYLHYKGKRKVQITL